MAVNQRRSLAATAIIGSALASGVGSHWISAIALGNQQIRETPDDLRDTPTGRLHFHRNGNGVTVVFNHKHDRQLLIAGRIHGFPELTFTGGSVTRGAVNHFIALKSHILELAIVTVLLPGCVRMASEIPSRFRTAYGLQELRAGR